MHRSKPLLIWDGDCGFCGRAVERWKARTGDRVEFETYQIVGREFPQISTQDFEKAVHFIDRDGSITKGAEAVYRLMTYAPGKSHWYKMYRKVPGFAFVSEASYKVVAQNRLFFSKFM